ncbi:1-deoxy-D-xylulose-5-phosphate synthase [Thermosipho melanesiensis]|uniref:1-deoxy-D-xylulose-5-phosphate synthase n=2 Tax=Thermosipho melanesiensis TaxID=46541 RepID=A6LJM5_THEM4|nr:1-deoxy-D-xylulose-5-phosphate synthase [Thermosipho melanesiensis]ABR30126.1 deoxyxylulose-5-phosphate synthase [Thermosipho melanesiensis BI429]APT73323.1 1-deoxy-D-xylulose-5-phosphate synthase [Thermosipho melanesiensis]OOC38713.1 1-deoxy-D-xylulose-5-phosphate synthase [Thermosipho melanesiensis]OOC40517.1 1-deoxy-D-xylulose-5-phosphate synthase [Thermosipho melanesiensis]OOC40782.1 1-deoxy-D-xylulose-5-phosphate synthase [Thermosipho melanesiensis]
MDYIEYIRKLDYQELERFASEIRRYIINVVSKNGGHLAPNLGVVELTLSLYRVFNPYEDYIIWDTGHQTYVHKLLTGRWDLFPTIRKFDGLSGYTNIFESEYDRFGAGHVGTAIAAALGIEKALELKGKKANVVVVIGDGALTSGESLEALNQIKTLNSKLKIIVNNNSMSISKNVGALSHFLEKLRTSKFYLDTKKTMKRAFSKGFEEELKKIRDALKVTLTGEDFFEGLGLKHFGPIDGHNFKELEDEFRRIKDYDYPTVVTVNTVKGKGFKNSESNPEKFHSASKFDISSGTFLKEKGIISYSEAFGRTLSKLAEKDDKIIVITAAMKSGTGLKEFSEKFPKRFFDLGITEQMCVTFAGGLATIGMKPVFAVYSTFLQRAFDQIIHDIALQRLPIIFAIDRAGVVGEDGPTHHGVFDIAYLRMIPNIKIYAPKDVQDLMNTLYTLLNTKLGGPVAIRYPRDYEFGDFEELCDKINMVDVDKWKLLNEGKDVAIISTGFPTKAALKVARKNNFTLVFARSIKPIDVEMLKWVFENHNVVFSVEEGVKIGGFGEGLLSYGNVEVIAIDDEFVPHGSRKELLKYLNLDVEGIERRMRKVLERRNIYENANRIR